MMCSTPGTTCGTPFTSCTTSCTPAQPGPQLQLNWSHFKPEFAGKPTEDAEAHLLRMNDLMDTHAFQEGVKVQTFCLTLVGEARLQYETLKTHSSRLKWSASSV